MKVELIKNLALELGLDLIGFTDITPLNRIKNKLKDRVDKKLNTEFEASDLQKRIDPKKIMGEANSIIVVGFPYFYANFNGNDSKDSLFGKLSRSSWGMDYHLVIKKYLQKLVDELSQYEKFDYSIITDTSPLVDREIAYKAGIGYYGKNTSIINQTYGSFIFIGYILTDLYLDKYNSPIESQCGDCDICMRSCPGKAIEEPYKLNPKKCISYLTQTKKYLDEEESKKMGINIYGCDICQMVCPKNINTKESTFDEFKPYKTNGVVDIKEILIMSNEEFKNKYGDMAGSWRGKNVLVRNAIIALENIGYIDDEIVEYLMENKSELLKPYIARYITKFSSK